MRILEGFLELGRARLWLSLMVLSVFSTCVSAQDFLEEFNLGNRKLGLAGESRYFNLNPGFQIVLVSSHTKLTITVLHETKEIGGVVTRVFEEQEEVGSELYEVSCNFYAIDPQTKDVFYFGEEVDFYKGGQVVDHKGAWLAYQSGDRPGLIMAPTPWIGMRYYQELAPGVAMDRVEVVRMSQTIQTPVGQLSNCLLTKETSAIEPITGYKTCAPGIGLVQDQSLKLVSYGYRR
ncbi:hypothetical protein [uncultured Meiothermus sp.]|uniref:hypothetical protein n=1 Tax=uncultured Meiothermus sp. TaxID=157471 RepID=UPI00262991DA|nr:hypothetical protein [uncultured Meiothermus sp.]